MSREAARAENGSVSVLTLLAIGLIAGTFFYVSLIGSRTSETTRARVAADATAMAAATVKAKVMNYEAFVLLADTVLLPLGQITANIGEAQAAAEGACLLISIALPEVLEYCLGEYGEHVIKTEENREKVDSTVSDWLTGLEEFAVQLQKVGPQWAAFAASRAGTTDSYSGPGNRGVTAAAAFPIPKLDKDSECTRLGIEMVDNTTDTRDGDSTRNACHDMAWLEAVYMAASLDPLAALIDEAGMVLTNNSLIVSLGGGCAKTNQVPKLADNWQDYSVSRGLTLTEASQDKKILPWMDSLRRKPSVSLVQPGYLLGMGCAEHYAQDHYGGDESLWHMDWRARLVPCRFDQERATKAIVDCGVTSEPAAAYSGVLQVGKMQLQFEHERLVGALPYWKY